ncbi:MAG: hypothetical protein M0Q54_08180, partial [Pigmentiphaga sp.]|nr:hypothetical protein [Pigmentiphaga sp.]
ITVVAFVACDKEDVNQANIQFALDQDSFRALQLAEPIQITGTITADDNITGISFTGVKAEGESYVAKGDAQEFLIANVKDPKNISVNMEYFVDSKEMTHIEVKVMVDKASKSHYISIGGVAGEAKGSAFVGQVILRADTLVWNAENTPDVYTTPNTGAISTTPSFFSIHGVDISGEKKHVLSIEDLRSVEGLNGSFCFLNVLQNTANKAYIGGQRGYMFTNLFPSQLGGGTTGRQCDVYEIDGKAIRQENIDTTQFKIIAGSWIGGDWKEDRYRFVDSLFVVISDEASTEAAKLKAYYLLGKIQTVLDNATLGEENEPTNLGAVNFARRRTNAGTAGTSVMAENFRAGDYIILKNVKGGKLYYGIMQIAQMYDDTSTFVDVEGVGQKIGQDEAHSLFLKPLILNVKVQTQL